MTFNGGAKFEYDIEWWGVMWQVLTSKFEMSNTSILDVQMLLSIVISIAPINMFNKYTPTHCILLTDCFELIVTMLSPVG